MATLLPLSKVKFMRDSFGNLLNPRGEVGDTTGLQSSLEQDGQEEAITVWDLGEGFYGVCSGHRRTVAMRALGCSEILAEIKPMPLSEAGMIAAMLAANVNAPVKPTMLGHSFKRIMLEKYWTVERVAALMGYKVEDVRLHLDLICASASVQLAVDAGRMSLSAFRELKNKPAVVQDKAAALDRPTVQKVRDLARKEAAPDSQAQPMIGAAFAGLEVNAMIAQARALKMQVFTGWETLGEYERTQLLSIIESISSHIKGGS